jgi:hypothetical protein
MRLGNGGGMRDFDGAESAALIDNGSGELIWDAYSDTNAPLECPARLASADTSART